MTTKALKDLNKSRQLKMHFLGDHASSIMRCGCPEASPNRVADGCWSLVTMEKVNTTERLTRLRELMKKYKVDIYSM